MVIRRIMSVTFSSVIYLVVSHSGSSTYFFYCIWVWWKLWKTHAFNNDCNAKLSQEPADGFSNVDFCASWTWIFHENFCICIIVFLCVFQSTLVFDICDRRIMLAVTFSLVIVFIMHFNSARSNHAATFISFLAFLRFGTTSFHGIIRLFPLCTLAHWEIS